MQVQIPALHPQSKLTSLRCGGIAFIAVDFWDLISAPALVELAIRCQGLRFTDHSRTAPPAAVAALERGILNAILQILTESSLQPELAIMESCGMVVQSVEEFGFLDTVKLITLELGKSTPAMVDLRRSADLPFTPAALSSHQRLPDDSFLEHALQQQAWHAEFRYQSIYDSDDLLAIL